MTCGGAKDLLNAEGVTIAWGSSIFVGRKGFKVR